MSKNKTVILGAPGTGKTTKLISILEELKGKYYWDNICFVTFSNSAINEAKDRVKKKFNITDKELIYFGTFHSICRKGVEINPKNIVKQKDIYAFFKELKISYEMESKIDMSDNILMSSRKGKEVGNIIIEFYKKIRLEKTNYDTMTKRDMIMYWNEWKQRHLMGKESQITSTLDNEYIINVTLKWKKYKEDRGLFDFTDMLTLALKSNLNVPTKILIVDEFQDMSPIQYEVYKNFCNNKDEVYIAGDDDQNIYTFMGATPQFLLNEYKNASNQIILKETYRQPSNILDNSQNLIRNIDPNNRQEKNIIPVKTGGIVLRKRALDEYNIIEEIIENSKKYNNVFVLLRTNWYVSLIKNALMDYGIPFKTIGDKGKIWSENAIGIYNGVIKLFHDRQKTIIDDDIIQLIMALPQKNFIKRGVKKDIKNDRERFMDKQLYDYVKPDLWTITTKNKLVKWIKLTQKQQTSFNKMKFDVLIEDINIEIGTFHSAKGKEAECVIVMPRLSKLIIKKINEKSIYEEEIRNLYVAVTRASKKLLYLMWGDNNENILC